jgi:hypothetical protein
MTGLLADGTATTSTLYWNGTAWTENLNFFVDALGNATTSGALAILWLLLLY